jgi:hypothetical protein
MTPIRRFSSDEPLVGTHPAPGGPLTRPPPLGPAPHRVIPVIPHQVAPRAAAPAATAGTGRSAHRVEVACGVEGAVGGQGMEVDMRVEPVAKPLGQHHHPHSQIIPAQTGAIKGMGRLHGRAAEPGEQRAVTVKWTAQRRIPSVCAAHGRSAGRTGQETARRRSRRTAPGSRGPRGAGRSAPAAGAGRCSSSPGYSIGISITSGGASDSNRASIWGLKLLMMVLRTSFPEGVNSPLSSVGIRWATVARRTCWNL